MFRFFLAPDDNAGGCPHANAADVPEDLTERDVVDTTDIAPPLNLDGDKPAETAEPVAETPAEPAGEKQATDA